GSGVRDDAVPAELTPLATLLACHQQIGRQCETLAGLVPYLEQRGADEEMRAGVATVIRYFDMATLQYHADEEVDLFPALLEANARSDPRCLRALTQLLSAEQCELESRWRRLRKVLAAVARGDAA